MKFHLHLIYTPKTSAAFPASVFTKLTNAQQQCVQISDMECQMLNVETIGSSYIPYLCIKGIFKCR